MIEIGPCHARDDLKTPLCEQIIELLGGSIFFPFFWHRIPLISPGWYMTVPPPPPPIVLARRSLLGGQYEKKSPTRGVTGGKWALVPGWNPFISGYATNTVFLVLNEHPLSTGSNN